MRNYAMMFFSRFRAVFFSLAFMVLLVSCMNDEDGLATEPVEVAYVSIYHASPDAPDFDIVVDGRVINNSPFEFSDYSGYLNFYTGNRNIRFNSLNASNALIDTTFNLEEGRAYSLFAINRLSDIEALLVVDSAAAPAQGKSMVRFVHLSPDAPAFGVSLQGHQGQLFGSMSFKQASEFREVDAKTYTFNITGGDVVLSTEEVTLHPGMFYTVVVRGFANPPQGNPHILSVEVLD